MTQTRYRMMKDLVRAGYADRTRQAYLQSFDAFVPFHDDRDPSEMGQAETRAWVDHLLDHAGIGHQRQNQHFAALKFLYKRTLGRPEAVSFILFRKRTRAAARDALGRAGPAAARGATAAQVPYLVHDGLQRWTADQRGLPSDHERHRCRGRQGSGYLMFPAASPCPQPR